MQTHCMTWRAVCPEHSDLGPASSKVVFLEELGMTWSTEECTEQLGSSKDFLKRELRVCMCMSVFLV